MVDRNGQERDELHRAIWSIADDLRGSVDGWDFKSYVLGTMFYRYISENLTKYINEGEHAAGNDNFDYAALPDEEAEQARAGLIEEKGFFILPSELFCNVRKRAPYDENLNVTLERIFTNIEDSAKGSEAESNLAGLFDDFDVNSNKLGPTVAKRNEKLVKLLNGVAEMRLGDYKNHHIDAFGDAYEYLMTMYASNAGKSGGEFFTPADVSELLTRLGTVGKTEVNKVCDPACGSGSLHVKMTKRERVIDAVNHKQTDFVPYEVGFTYQEYEKVSRYLKDDRFVEKIGNHIDSVYYDGFLEEITPGSGYWKDDFGVVWNRNGVDKDIGVIDGFVITEPDKRKIKMPQLDEKRIRGGYEALMSRSRDTFRFGSIGFSMFERAWTLCGMENLLVYMLLEPEFTDDLLDAILEYNLRVIEIGLEYDLDGFHFGDDWGQQIGLIMGPKHWRRYIKPRMAAMYAKVKSKGLIVSQHSCGDIYEIFPDLIEIGLDIYQTFQPEIYDIRKVKSEFGKDLSFWGGISTQRLLPFASPGEVKRVTRETLSIMGKGGGYIAAPTHDIPGDVPPENVVAMLEVLQNQ
ncbi:MAG: type I restriction-modification system subunit M [Clostridiales bacterium]|nr:type I restriction-modification system subunit M [Clostridiales bacterium]